MRRYLEERLRLARAEGSEGLIGELIQVEKERGRITPDEMVSMVFLLLGAGSETTTHLISGSVYELLKDPSRRDWLEQDWRPRQPRGGGIFALRLAGAVLKAALCEARRRARRGPSEEGRPHHGDDCGRQHRPGRARPIPSGSISSGGRTGTSRSAPESISASAINWHGSRRCARCRRCLCAGQNFGSRSSHRRSTGGGGRDCGQSRSCRSRRAANRVARARCRGHCRSRSAQQPDLRVAVRSSCRSRAERFR